MGRKRPRGACHAFAKEGSCKFGDECKFSHEAGPRTEDGDTPQYSETQSGSTMPLYAPGSGAQLFQTGVKPRVSEDRVLADTTPSLEGFEHVRVLRHPNGVRVLIISQDHPARLAGVESVVFRLTDGEEMAPVQVSGKNKRGGIRVKKESTICEIVTRRGETFTVQAGVEGQIIETNHQLSENPAPLNGSGSIFLALIV
mmetsp:Transcript_5201/g.9369  ORF Transcript_5201/g.9369 Transcript_5201/m.9369 type:complete len:199 (+) Transcript_5201:319-915(+)